MMQNLIREGIAYSAEQARICEGSFQRVVFPTQDGIEGSQIRIQYLQRVPVKRVQIAFTLNEVNGSSLFRTRLRENQCSRRKIECRQSDLSGDPRSGLFPLQSSGDHQIDRKSVV